ncbi:MAG: leucine-rich repeat domain-containing protein [Clostridiales bacterium]|nr:leucine-rich repeat domain-containing protein [Clostridiales bacterium]
MDRGRSSVRFLRSLSLVLSVVFFLFAFCSCDKEKSEYEERGIRFFRLSDCSGYDFQNDYNGPSDAYLCSIEDSFHEAELTIPTEFKGKPVVAVKTSAAGNSTLTHLIIPEGIQYIEGGFSDYSALVDIEFPSSLKAIYAQSFERCAVETLEFEYPIQVVSGFSYCSALRSVTFHGDVGEIYSRSFNHCDNLASVVFEGEKGVISDSSFAACPLLDAADASDSPVLVPEADDPDLTDEDWAVSLIRDAVDKLIAEGSVEESSISPYDLIGFDGEGNIAFTSDEAAAAYANAELDEEGRIIWGCYTGNGCSVFIKSSNDNASVPHYACIEDRDTPQDAFAETRGQCRYFIIYAGIVSRVDENFYEGAIDRRTMATVVFVIDAVDREVVHIKYIGSDCPGAVTDHTTGKVMFTEAMEYMDSIGG